jgi:type IV pilus assembly protein PilB
MSATAEHVETASAGSRRGRRLGDILVELEFCSREEVEDAGAAALDAGMLIGDLLLERGSVTEEQLVIAIATRFGLEHRSLDEITLDFGAAALLPVAEARRQRVVPVAFGARDELIVAVANPANYLAFDDVSMLTGLRVRPVVVSPGDLDALLRRVSVLDESLVADQAAAEAEKVELAPFESANDAPTIKLVRSIIGQAVDRGASDIHFDPDVGGLEVRYRVDGVMESAARVPRRQAAAVISRIKILAELDISERRLPQDGRLAVDLDGRSVDIRVAIMPLVEGEAAALRILDSGASPRSLEDLGVSADDRARLDASLRSSHGGVLVTGPTGSGKTTTLYAIIALLRSPELTLMTIEDPVEYRFAGVNQIQVSERHGLSFSTGLRAIMRADPDVIMVGEMRDRESAHIAVEAALTGHLVLSTLHTNDAPSAALRLIDMGIEPYLVASSINCVVAQRLMRQLCTTCRRPVRVPAAHVGRDGDGEVEIFEAVGCARCRNTGYLGRLGIYEVMTVSDAVRSLIVARALGQEIARVAVAEGMRPLREDGLEKVRAGLTTLSELGRVLG